MAKKREAQDITFPEQKIVNIDLEHEMKTAFIDYAMSVIVARALPDVRDGLKPVHRRILYTMYEEGLTSDKKYSKSVATVGTVLRNYHPHGDTSVYDALVRLAQDFSMRYPLVDGKGNFGSVDGDPAAAYRYTEARLDKLSNEMLRDIDKETIDYGVNFDETRKEPIVIPSRFPNLLVNGSMGIAVGMTTNIPPHNLREAINAAICVIRNPEATLDELMEHLTGPDFPTGGIIMGRSGIRAAYGTGRGAIRVRARTEMEEAASGRMAIIVTEIPYMVNKARLVESIAEQVKEKKIEGIAALRDESDREGMRIVIELKRDANPQVVLNRLFAATSLQVNFAVVMLALVNNQTQPKVLTLKEILDEYVAFQKQVVIRRTEYDLKKARERAHLLEGYRIAVDNIDEVIRIIRTSYNDAKERLMERFGLSEIQAQAILEMQLRRLQGLEREKIEAEYQELMEKIAYYLKLLSDEKMLEDLLVSELEEIRDKYGDDRRTEIAMVEGEIDVEDLIDEEDSCYTLTNAGYIKRMPASTYKAQRRGGRGITAMATREEDFVKTLFVASTHDYLLFFTNTGKVHRKKGYQIPESGRTAKGTAIVNVLPLEQGEQVTAMIPVRAFDDSYLMMITRMGTVKRLRLEEINTARKAGIRALTLEEGDALISVLKTTGEDAVIIASAMGQAMCFAESDVRCMGRDAAGVRGIRLDEGDYVVGAQLATPGWYLLSVTEKGYGKRTAVEEYMPEDGELRKRGGKGLRNYNITEKTGPVASVNLVCGNEDIMLLSDDGTMIRMDVADVNVYGRSTQGVRVMKLAEGSRVIGVEAVAKDEEDDADEGSEEEAEASQAEKTAAEAPEEGQAANAWADDEEE